MQCEVVLAALAVIAASALASPIEVIDTGANGEPRTLALVADIPSARRHREELVNTARPHACGKECDEEGGLRPEPVAAQDDATGLPQNLYPAFQPLFPLGHSRPPTFQEHVYNPRPRLLGSQYSPPGPSGPPGLERAYPQPAAASSAELHASSLLGSGNFGVIHGGTFYGEERDAPQNYESPSAALHSYYGGNGHGRPAFLRGNPEPQRYRAAEDFFANFRDFADISTPTKSSFSEYYAVYVNRNASRADPGIVVVPEAVPVSHGPKNIFEQLTRIDHEHEDAPAKKLSASKRKLALLDKKRGGSREAQHEPLLALS